MQPAAVPPHRAIVPFLIGDLLLVLANAVSLGAGWWRSTSGLIWKISTLLDAGSDGSLPSWFLACQLFLVAYLIGQRAAAEMSRARRATWLLACLSLPFAALSFDAVADLHSWTSSRVPRILPSGILYPASFSARNLYTLSMAAFIVVAAGLLYLAHPSRQAILPILLRFLGALALFLAGTLTLEGNLRWGVSHAVSLEIESIGGALARLLGATALLWAAGSIPGPSGAPAIGSSASPARLDPRQVIPEA